MRVYWGQKAIVKNDVIVALDKVESFCQYGEMSDGSKVYKNKDAEYFLRMKFHGQFVFVKI